jgi:hypothetical protein
VAVCGVRRSRRGGSEGRRTGAGGPTGTNPPLFLALLKILVSTCFILVVTCFILDMYPGTFVLLVEEKIIFFLAFSPHVKLIKICI